MTLALLLSSLLACDEGVALQDQTITVACGRCIYEMPEAQGCPWAAEIDGEHLFIQGVVPQDHSSHDPDGICNMERKAVVDGHIRDGKLITTRFELLPPDAVPEAPRFTPEDIH